MTIPINYLCGPEPEYAARDVDNSHVHKLIASFENYGNRCFPMLAVCFRKGRPTQAQLDDEEFFKKNPVYVIGGEHRRQALLHMFEQDEYSPDSEYATVVRLASPV